MKKTLIVIFTAACTVSSCGNYAKKGTIVPKKKIELFNRKDLSGFYVWLAETGYSDPDSVFRIKSDSSGENLIWITGQHLGGLITKSKYQNYKLVAEYRWGQKTWGLRKKKARDAGILLHCQGDDGNNLENFKSPWLRSIEYQIIEGGTGDLLFVSGYDRNTGKLIKPSAKISVAKGTRVWTEGGNRVTFDDKRIDCFYRDTAWKDILGFRGNNDIEKLSGSWNTIEIIAHNDKLVYYLNGIKVNEASGSSFTSGKILFQSEYAEILFRKIDIYPL